VRALVEAESITALVRELALQSQLVARDTGHWILRVERESLNQPASRERLQNALAECGHAVKLAVEVGAGDRQPGAAQRGGCRRAPARGRSHHPERPLCSGR
jgi:DNA polymerase-3 subunit gamma/tau